MGEFYYSDKYCDSEFEYRHVIVPYEKRKTIPKDRLMTETQWRDIGVQQSRGWIHYMMHVPEPHILLFRRRIPIKAISDQWKKDKACDQRRKLNA